MTRVSADYKIRVSFLRNAITEKYNELLALSTNWHVLFLLAELKRGTTLKQFYQRIAENIAMVFSVRSTYINVLKVCYFVKFTLVWK